jgi:hypothetical protein
MNIVTIETDEILKTSDKFLFKNSSVANSENGADSGKNRCISIPLNTRINVNLK